MLNIKQYFEYEKNNLDPSEGDFLCILNNIDTRKISYGVSINKNINGVGPKYKEYFGWAFGVAGFSLAAFMFFVNSNISNNNSPAVATISKQDIETLKEKSKRTVIMIDSINSFEQDTTIIE